MDRRQRKSRDAIFRAFSQLLAQKRVGAAEMLLKNSNLKVSEIAERVSPGAEHYFFASFKKITGMSPLQYRKIYQPESV